MSRSPSHPSTRIGTEFQSREALQAAVVRERAHYSILNRYGFIVASVMQIIGCKLVPHGLG
jgi:hypothetical protein